MRLCSRDRTKTRLMLLKPFFITCDFGFGFRTLPPQRPCPGPHVEQVAHEPSQSSSTEIFIDMCYPMGYICLVVWRVTNLT